MSFDPPLAPPYADFAKSLRVGDVYSYAPPDVRAREVEIADAAYRVQYTDTWVVPVFILDCREILPTTVMVERLRSSTLKPPSLLEAAEKLQAAHAELAKLLAQCADATRAAEAALAIVTTLQRSGAGSR